MNQSGEFDKDMGINISMVFVAGVSLGTREKHS